MTQPLQGREQAAAAGSRSLCDDPAVDLVLLDMYLPDGGAAGLQYFVEVGMAMRSLRHSGGGRPEVEYPCQHTEGDADPISPPR
jgi:hypothetical protein